MEYRFWSNWCPSFRRVQGWWRRIKNDLLNVCKAFGLDPWCSASSLGARSGIISPVGLPTGLEIGRRGVVAINIASIYLLPNFQTCMEPCRQDDMAPCTGSCWHSWSIHSQIWLLELGQWVGSGHGQILCMELGWQLDCTCRLTCGLTPHWIRPADQPHPNDLALLPLSPLQG